MSSKIRTTCFLLSAAVQAAVLIGALPNRGFTAEFAYGTRLAPGAESVYFQPDVAVLGDAYTITLGATQSVRDVKSLSGENSMISFDGGFKSTVPTNPSAPRVTLWGNPADMFVDGSSVLNGFYDGVLLGGTGIQNLPAVPGTWKLDVVPTAGEAMGTPVLVKINVNLNGSLAALGDGTAEAIWDISTNHGGIVNGASQAILEEKSFSDSGQQVFSVPIGGSFELTAIYVLEIHGVNEASSRADFLKADISIHVIPEPSTLTLATLSLLGLVAFGWRRSRYASP